MNQTLKTVSEIPEENLVCGFRALVAEATMEDHHVRVTDGGSMPLSLNRLSQPLSLSLLKSPVTTAVLVSAYIACHTHLFQCKLTDTVALTFQLKGTMNCPLVPQTVSPALQTHTLTIAVTNRYCHICSAQTRS